MNKELEFAKELIQFIQDSPTAFHAVSSAEEILDKQGFNRLDSEDKWDIKKEVSIIPQ